MRKKDQKPTTATKINEKQIPLVDGKKNFLRSSKPFK